MEGHVRKRGNMWYYSFEAASIDGKRKRIERVGGRTKKEAEAALRKAIEEYNHAVCTLTQVKYLFLIIWITGLKITCK